MNTIARDATRGVARLLDRRGLANLMGSNRAMAGMFKADAAVLREKLSAPMKSEYVYAGRNGRYRYS